MLEWGDEFHAAGCPSTSRSCICWDPLQTLGEQGEQSESFHTTVSGGIPCGLAVAGSVSDGANKEKRNVRSLWDSSGDECFLYKLFFARYHNFQNGSEVTRWYLRAECAGRRSRYSFGRTLRHSNTKARSKAQLTSIHALHVHGEKPEGNVTRPCPGTHETNGGPILD